MPGSKTLHPTSVSLLGHRMHKMSDLGVIDLVSNAIGTCQRYIVGNHNSHSFYLCIREPLMRGFYSIADYVLIDGMSLIMLGRLFGLSLRRQDRATSLDFMPLLLPQAVKNGWRIYFLGSRPGVAECGAAKLRETYPGLLMRTHHGYFNAEKSGSENRQILADIAAYDPHVLFVGMGMPRQELWILENREQLSANVVFVCGAHMDYVAGQVSTPPRWLAAIYLEWLYRLITEPRRLWNRYLIEPWAVVAEILKQQLKT
jgi:N-acetylglucosaminyldiphosphoundecaprenol N-acetyl-beta-D-mannosaminyltransferase